MRIFEYLSVLTSIIFSLSAAQILTRICTEPDPDRRYWVHVLRVFFAPLLHLLIWWQFRGYHDVPARNVLAFALLLLEPTIPFVCSSTLVHAARLKRSQRV